MLDNQLYESREVKFPVRKARELVKDLFRPKPEKFWFDFLIHIAAGWLAFAATLAQPVFSYWQIVFFIISTLGFYKAILFIHEIVHLKKGTFTAFRWTWNLFCGCPFMIPTFLYQSVHMGHHKRDSYGTDNDGEYFPFAIESRIWIITYLLFSFLIPILILARFVILAPLSLLNKRLRSYVLRRLSSLSIAFNYERPVTSWKHAENWQSEELITSLFGLTVVGLTFVGIVPIDVLILWYFIVAAGSLLNAIQTLVGHRYRKSGDDMIDLGDQILDSVTIPGHKLWAPVGLRFHATHHLFPDLPYHSLEEAHYRLIDGLEESSGYRQTVQSGLLPALRRLWKQTEH